MKLSVITAVAILAAGPVVGSAFAQSTSATQPKPTDQELSDLIAKKISNDKTLSPDGILVNVAGGVATLTGIVGKNVDKAKAEAHARVPGIVRVENKLTSRETVTGKVKDTAGAAADTSKKGAKNVKGAATKTGEVITDAWISTRIKTKFMGDSDLRASEIKVDSNDHVVTLSGTVPNAAAHAKALTIAKGIEGVNRVVDNLKIVAKTDKS